MSQWGWKPERAQGIWRHGAGWLRPSMTAIPYATVGLLLLMFHLVGGTLTSAKGILFDLPGGSLADGDSTRLVALALPMQHEELVFFDDARYTLGDASSMRSFGQSLSECVERSERKVLLVLADSRIPAGRLMELATVARASGVRQVLFAEKRPGVGE